MNMNLLAFIFCMALAYVNFFLFSSNPLGFRVFMVILCVIGALIQLPFIFNK